MEMLDLVNEQDKVIGQAPRKEVEEKGALYRVSGMFVFIGGKVLIEKRSENKKIRPGNYSIIEETLKSGETYEAAALRGTKEETGLEVNNLKEIGRKIIRDAEYNDNFIIRVFMSYGEGEIKMQKEEVEEIKLLNKNQLKELINSTENKSPALTESIEFLKGIR